MVGSRWHPQPPVFHRANGPREDYSEVYRFPCCDTYVVMADGAPSQFRDDGCEPAPES